jgi:hypothetical protein
MNREVHVRICEGRGLRCPRLLGVVVSDEGKGVRFETSGGDREGVALKVPSWDSLLMCRYRKGDIETRALYPVLG